MIISRLETFMQRVGDRPRLLVKITTEQLRPDRPGWGVEIDESALAHDDYVHWERRARRRRDGSTAYM